MSAEFERLLQDARERAKTMSASAADSLATDPYPEFWRYAADLTARWSDALAHEPIDWACLAAVREEARTEKHRAGIWLFAHCNGIETTYEKLREASLLSEEDASRNA